MVSYAINGAARVANRGPRMRLGRAVKYHPRLPLSVKILTVPGDFTLHLII